MKTIKETKLNTISSLTNTHMTKLLPQELSIYSKKEYQKCPHITKCSKSYGFVYLMICDTAQCKIGITQNLYQRLQQINRQLIPSKTKIMYLYASPLCMNTLDIEKNFKEYFKNYNISGNDSKHEWFDKAYIDLYLEYLNNSYFDFNFPSSQQIEKEIENIHKFANIIFSNYMENPVPSNNDYNQLLKEYINTTNKAAEQLNEIHDIFNYIFPKEYKDSIDYICEYNKISRLELLKLSLIMYINNFNRKIKSSNGE
jgi:predicted GIY-YIG superfamily endonuclease